ncbi:MAG: hypothetical protein J5630_07275 [Bacteroidaceae bacterium]|nr:hypothetical protein [Bacteroidaceae bacterium]
MQHLFRSIIIILVLLNTYTSHICAQTVGYTYNALGLDGCILKYSVAKQDTTYYIIATVRSSRMNFLNEPMMKIRTFNDEVLTLRGVAISSNTKSAGIISGNMVLPVTQISATAQFFITPKEFEMLNNGVSKIRLSMTPMNHERKFKKDKIGKKLYQFYLRAKDKDDEF